MIQEQEEIAFSLWRAHGTKQKRGFFLHLNWAMVGGSGGMLPQGNFENLWANMCNLSHFLHHFLLYKTVCDFKHIHVCLFKHIEDGYEPSKPYPTTQPRSVVQSHYKYVYSEIGQLKLWCRGATVYKHLLSVHTQYWSVYVPV